MARAGQTIAWSGVTVMIGFLGLLMSPILETRCAGIGGALVVCVSVLAALTLLPAGLVLLGPYLEALVGDSAAALPASSTTNLRGAASVDGSSPERPLRTLIHLGRGRDGVVPESAQTSRRPPE